MTSKEYHEGYQQGYKDAKEKPTTKNDLPKYCDRNICLKNEYNNVGCEDCEVTKSQEPATKNVLAVDCIVDVLGSYTDLDIPYKREIAENILTKLPSITPQEPQSFEWCETCKEYDQEKHCCHRWTKVIRNTVEEMKQTYIEREVLDKIRAEIKALPTEHTAYGYNSAGKLVGVSDAEFWTLKLISSDSVLEIFDKYNAESEDKE